MRSHISADITAAQIGQDVTICGWVNTRRDHGGVIFIDLRDHAGIVQVVYDPDTVESFATAESVRNEFVLQVKGRVRARPEGTVNPDMITGEIEILGKELNILNVAETPPFQLDDENVSEDVRLRHRYIDLRRPQMQDNLRIRAKVVREMRNFLDDNDFLDIETPMLTKATPEGARDYLVPSRTHPGSFFALPQSPQLFKQLLMMSGMDRYYQIVRCFRDEDLRADRQPEFTQLDIETSFMDEVAFTDLMEDLTRHLFKRVMDVDLPNPFPRMTYKESMERFGNDKPDLRIPLELTEVSDLMKAVEFKVFSGPANSDGGRVAALHVPKGCQLSRKQIDDYTKFVGIYGAKGLAYIKVNERDAGRDGLQSPILKFLPDGVVQSILERTGANDGDLIFFGADSTKVVNEALGALRDRIGHDLGLVEEGWAPLWVIDFPMFDWNEGEKRWDALHHPFTAPNSDNPADLEAQPGDMISRAYDMVLNGSEIGGGSMRIHNFEMQQKVFEMLGISDEDAEEKFGFLVEAMKHGCPPHGGMAYGLDRVVMLMTGSESIRDVIAFPKTQTAACLLTQAPAPVSPKQLRELSIGLRISADKEKPDTPAASE